MQKCNGILAAGSKLSSRAKISQATLFMTPVVIYIASLIKGVQANENLDQWLHTEIEYELPDIAAILDTKPNLHNQILLNQEIVLAQPNAATIIDSQEFILLSQAITNHHTALANDMPTVHKFEQTDFTLVSEASYTHKAIDTQLWHDSKVDLEITQLFDDHALQTIADDNADPAPVESGTSGLKIAMWSILAGAAVSTGIALGITKSDSDDNSNTAGSSDFTVITAKKIIATEDVKVGEGTLTITDGSITDSSGAIDFENENLSTTGKVTGGSLTDGTATLSSGALAGATTVTASGAVTAGSFTDGTATMSNGTMTGLSTMTVSGTVKGGTITDGTATLSSGALSDVTTVTASGAVTGGSLTDGAATLTGGALTDATTVTASGEVTGGSLTTTGAVTGGSLTDGTATLSSGALAGVTTVTASGEVTGGSLTTTGAVTGGSLTDGTATLSSGALTDATTVTASGEVTGGSLTTTGAVTGGSLTDGTATLSSGALSGVTTVTASGEVTGGSLTTTGAVTGGSLTDGTATLSSGALAGVTTVTASGEVTGGSLTTTGAVTGGSLTDGTATLSSGALSGVTTVTASGEVTGGSLTTTGAVTGGSLTDGTATLSSGALAGVTTVTASGEVTGGSLTTTGAITGGSLTDGTATLSSGALSGVTTVTASGAVTGGSFTDGIAIMSNGTMTGLSTMTASGAVTGGSLTDGTATLSSGALAGVTTVTASGEVTGGSLTTTGAVTGGSLTDGTATLSSGTLSGVTSIDITGSAGLILENDETITNSVIGTVLINGIVAAGTGSAAGIFQSSGDHDLILQTGNSTTGSITITDEANGNITITPNGSGEVDISKIDIDGGAIDGTAIGGSTPSTGAFTTTTASTSVDITGSAGLILENDETIKNSVDGTISITADNVSVSGDLTVSGNDLKFGNGQSISNASNEIINITAKTTALSGSIQAKGNATFTGTLDLAKEREVSIKLSDTAQLSDKFIKIMMPLFPVGMDNATPSYKLILPTNAPFHNAILKVGSFPTPTPGSTQNAHLDWVIDAKAAPSDQRVKTNIQDLTETVDPLSIINQLAPVTFEFDEIGLRVAEGDQTGTQIGLIAQDVAAVLPSTVITYGTHTDDVTGIEIEDFLYLEQNELTILNIAGIQALDEKIIALEEQLNADFSVQAVLNLTMSHSELNTATHSITAVGSFQTIDSAIDLHSIEGGSNGDILLLMSTTDTDWTLFDMDTVNNNEANIKLSINSYVFDSAGDSIELIFMNDTWYEKDYTDIQ